MKSRRRFVDILAAITVILTANSCALPLPIFDTRVRPTVSDASLVTGKPCLPPCWYDILPGNTSTMIALNKVRLLDFVNPTSVERTNQAVYLGTDDAIRWNYQGTNDFGGGIYISEGTVKWVRVDHPEFLVLEDIIATVGEPDWVWAGRAGGAGNHHIFRFVFEERGLMLESRMYGDNSQMPETVIVRPDIEIDEAVYFMSQSLAQYLIEIRNVSQEELDENIHDYDSWSGYGVDIKTHKD